VLEQALNALAHQHGLIAAKKIEQDVSRLLPSNLQLRPGHRLP
jgi:hypothetical protein